MRIGLEVNETAGGLSLDEVVEEVRTARDVGLDSAWSAQVFGLDALTALAVAGRAVPGIELGTAIVPTYPRHPMALAAQALTVQAAIGNRLTLGIGPSHQVLMEGRYGYSFAKPARHIREYLSALVPLLRGESVSYQGETLKAVGPINVPGAAAPPVLVAALGPTLLRIAGTLADGIIVANTGLKTIANDLVPAVTRAAADAGRPAPRVVAGMYMSVTVDAAAERDAIAVRFADAARLPSYQAALEREGAANFGEIAIVGDETEIARQVRRVAEAGVTDLMAWPTGSAENRARTVALLGSLARSGPASRDAAA